jgi:hypothetical protein
MCGMGTALTDKWSKVSLVAETGIARERKFTRHVLLIHSITSNLMETKGQITLYIGESLRNLWWREIYLRIVTLLGQEWLERFGYRFQIPYLGIPAYSASLVRIQTTEREIG